MRTKSTKKRIDKDNINLFWYGFWANVKTAIGIILAVLGFIGGAIGGADKNILTALIFFGLGVLGIVLFFKGKSQRFDYKRQSGAILHKGDW